MNFEKYGIYLSIAFFVAFGVWIMETINNRKKEKSERNHIACVFMAILGALVACWYLFVILSFSRAWDTGVPVAVRELTQEEIRQFKTKGIDIPQGTWAEIDANSKALRRIYLTEEQQGSFSWGQFQLRELAFSDADIFSFSPTGEQGKTELPTVIDVEGHQCSTDALFAFRLKNNQPITDYHPSDYYLSYCNVANQTVQTPQDGLNLGYSSFHDLSAMDKADKTALAAFIQPFNVAAVYYPSDLTDGVFDNQNALTSPAFKGKITVHSLYTDNRHQLIGLEGHLSNLDGIKIGQCQYADYVSVILTDFTQDTAHWHFKSEDIPENCKMQVLPYQLKITK